MARLPGSVNADDITGFNGRDTLTGGLGDDSLDGGNGNDRISGGYGSDQLEGGGGNDRLNGGRGEDNLQGGDGNDTLVSRSDAGEPTIAQDVNANNDPNGEVDAATGLVLPQQAGLPADDILTGGDGADTFRFETLIAAKQEILEKHADPNTGVIDYSMMGVAGENNLVHDHWVDSIGNDVITDFNQAEGDRIQIRGHTTEVSEINIVDADGDGQVDDTVLQLRSNQGANGGAHNLDLLGTITVLNNELDEGDFSVNAGVNYGIVRNISQVQEALNPLNPGSTDAPAPDSSGDDAPADPPADPDTGSGDDAPADPPADPDTGSGDDAPADPTPAPAPGNTIADLLTPPADAVAGASPTAGPDVVIYGAGDDNGFGGLGDDLIVGEAGNDSLGGGWGDDRMDGGTGDDQMMGNHGDDLIAGMDGDDVLSGNFGDDILVGGAGNDELKGNRGEDVLFGGADGDILSGGSGDDILHGGAGEDSIDGGSGTDAVLLNGAIGDYTVTVGEDTVQFTDAAGLTDIVSRVEQFRFLGSGETYEVQDGALALTADVEDLNGLLDDPLITDLIAAETGNDADVVALDLLAPASDAPAPAGDSATPAPTPEPVAALGNTTETMEPAAQEGLAA